MQLLRTIIISTLLIASLSARAQEIDARVTVNHQKIEQTSDAVFESLQTQLAEFINNRQWTSMQFRPSERLQCTFNFTVNKYDEGSNHFDCTLFVQCMRPVFNSSYTTTLFATQDNNVSFNYQEFDQLEFRTDQLDNELTALVGYYIYLMLGLDGDAMAPLGGTDLLQTAQTIVNNAQSFAGKGWKAFENDRNRYAVINDLMDSGMEPFRRMQYTYYRSGLDTMNENADRARAAITEAIELLKLAKENKPLSTLPLLFTEYKSDELVGIYKGKGTSTERQTVAEILSNINPSKNSEWNQFK